MAIVSSVVSPAFGALSVCIPSVRIRCKAIYLYIAAYESTWEDTVALLERVI